MKFLENAKNMFRKDKDNDLSALPAPNLEQMRPIRQIYDLYQANKDATKTIKTQTFYDEITGKYNYCYLVYRDEIDRCDVYQKSYELDKQGQIIGTPDSTPMQENIGLVDAFNIMRNFEAANEEVENESVECAIHKNTGKDYKAFALAEGYAIENKSANPAVIRNGEILSAGIYPDNINQLVTETNSQSLYQPQDDFMNDFASYIETVTQENFPIDAQGLPIFNSAELDKNPQYLTSLPLIGENVVYPLKKLAAHMEHANSSLKNNDYRNASEYLQKSRVLLFEVMDHFHSKSENYDKNFHQILNAILGKDFFNSLRHLAVLIALTNAKIFHSYALEVASDNTKDNNQLPQDAWHGTGLVQHSPRSVEDCVTTIEESFDAAVSVSKISDMPAWLRAPMAAYVQDNDVPATLPVAAIKTFAERLDKITADPDLVYGSHLGKVNNQNLIKKFQSILAQKAKDTLITPLYIDTNMTSFSDEIHTGGLAYITPYQFKKPFSGGGGYVEAEEMVARSDQRARIEEQENAAPEDKKYVVEMCFSGVPKVIDKRYLRSSRPERRSTFHRNIHKNLTDIVKHVVGSSQQVDYLDYKDAVALANKLQERFYSHEGFLIQDIRENDNQFGLIKDKLNDIGEDHQWTEFSNKEGHGNKIASLYVQEAGTDKDKPEFNVYTFSSAQFFDAVNAHTASGTVHLKPEIKRMDLQQLTRYILVHSCLTYSTINLKKDPKEFSFKETEKFLDRESDGFYLAAKSFLEKYGVDIDKELDELSDKRTVEWQPKSRARSNVIPNSKPQ